MPVGFDFSDEDLAWIRAIAQRAIVDGWAYHAAHEQAHRDVAAFYATQLRETGVIMRLEEDQSRAQREAYEAKTAELHAALEEKRAILEREAAERRRLWKEAKARREAANTALQPEFDRVGGRRKWVWFQRKKGRLLRDIADQLGVTPTRVREIEMLQQRLEDRRQSMHVRHRRNLGRPLDMGGPRDVWLTFYPSPDPHLDNMEPVPNDPVGDDLVLCEDSEQDRAD